MKHKCKPIYMYLRQVSSRGHRIVLRQLLGSTSSGILQQVHLKECFAALRQSSLPPDFSHTIIKIICFSTKHCNGNAMFLRACSKGHPYFTVTPDLCLLWLLFVFSSSWIGFISAWHGGLIHPKNYKNWMKISKFPKKIFFKS